MSRRMGWGGWSKRASTRDTSAVNRKLSLAEGVSESLQHDNLQQRQTFGRERNMGGSGARR